MDSSKLKVLIRAVETATFSAAGEELGFTQAGVSYIIKTLEASWGYSFSFGARREYGSPRRGRRLWSMCAMRTPPWTRF